MIIRIMGEGQFQMPVELVDRLNELDAKLEAALDVGDRDKFYAALTDLLDFVRKEGEPLPEDSLKPSDAILPSADTSAEELREMLTEEGLIPGT